MCYGPRHLLQCTVVAYTVDRSKFLCSSVNTAGAEAVIIQVVQYSWELVLDYGSKSVNVEDYDAVSRGKVPLL